jgi:hypothetical protein
MYRLIRFLIITFTLGRIRWLMRLTWVWRLIVFLGLTGWLSKKLRGMVGLDKRAATDVDSAWADALRYTPAPAGPAAASAPPAPRPAAKPTPAPVTEPIAEATDEVIGYAADGTSETITMHEVRAGDETETIVRIEDDAGNVETLVTDSPVEELDLANLGEPVTAPAEPVLEVEDIELEIVEEAEIDEIVDTLEAAEPRVEEAPKPKRTRKPKPVAEPVEPPAEAPIIDPDWVRGDGTDECPATHPVKAKATSMIYYVPESGHYGLTIPDVCFASPADAEAAGYRAPRR